MAWHREHLPDPLPAEPLEVAVAWLAEATRRASSPNPNAMVLATADAAGRPSARVVLCKQITPHPGYLTFYTNYNSRKGRELGARQQAAVVMHWDALHRQLRVEGRIVRTSAADSDAYFATRNWQSRLGAWVSQQSEPIGSRAELLAKVAMTALRFALPAPDGDEQASDPGQRIPRPPHWGGYQLWAEAIELWVEGSARIHDRARWERQLEPRGAGFEPGPWSVSRLQP
ncbi:MAG: pyridoxamine 5'-phosphate oxidase [Gammaproteobacteria bacterium]|nr:pyridoxamine 5'-phosphate oxidase [Gammaproteobacteria bacterium]MDE2250791.1 pyridoxamine 5'-phosphate oxidase [Gammaproteobacteria bacterium]